MAASKTYNNSFKRDIMPISDDDVRQMANFITEDPTLFNEFAAPANPAPAQPQRRQQIPEDYGEYTTDDMDLGDYMGKVTFEYGVSLASAGSSSSWGYSGGEPGEAPSYELVSVEAHIHSVHDEYDQPVQMTPEMQRGLTELAEKQFWKRFGGESINDIYSPREGPIDRY